MTATQSTRSRRVMLATDFSEASENALDHAATIAVRHHAELHIVHVQELYSEQFASDDEARLELVAYERAIERLTQARLAAQTPGAGEGIPIVRHHVRSVNAAEGLLEQVQTLGADLLVVGTHARKSIARAFLGSVATEVVRAARIPVLVVGPGRGHKVKDVDYRTLVCPTDLSPASAHALAVAARLAVSAGQVYALHITRDWDHPAAYLFGADSLHAAFPDIESRARAKVDEQVAAAPTCAAPITAVVTEGKPAKKIVEYARAHAADLLVMGASNSSTLDLLLLGSVTNKVLRTAPCPVLVVHEGDEAPVR